MVGSHRPRGLESMLSVHRQVIVLSPHMDDAVLSCGGALATFSRQISCTTVTLCTADPEVQQDALQPPHGIALPSERRHEEAAAMEALGCQLIQLGFLDAIYRTHLGSPKPLYPTLDSLWSMPVPADSENKEQLARLLEPILRDAASVPTLFLAPAGVGHHVDHILCTQTLLSLVSNLDSVLLYEDFPYVVDQGEHVGVSDSIEKALDRLNLIGEEKLEHLCDVDAKISLILNYPSQLDTIFGGREQIRPMLLRSGVKNSAVERFWRIRHK